MDQQHENLQELLTRLNNIRDSMWKRHWATSGASRTTGVGCSKPASKVLYVR
jgi:hypothetical protein